MSAAHLIDIKQLSEAELCDYLEYKFYTGIRQLLTTIHHYTAELSADGEGALQSEIFGLLFNKLEDETQQMMRNDEIIIFPLIRQKNKYGALSTGKVPVAFIGQMHKKIMLLLDKIRHQLNNYISKPEWIPAYKICIGEMFNLEQEIQQAIYLKENVLLLKMKDEIKVKDNPPQTL